MTTTNYLERARILNGQIQEKENQVTMLRSMTLKITPSYSDMPHSSTRNTHPMENAITKAVDLEDQLKKDRLEFKQLQTEIREVISQIPVLNIQMVMDLRYVVCLSWADIAQVMGYTERHIFRLHEMGLTMVTIPEG